MNINNSTIPGSCNPTLNVTPTFLGDLFSDDGLKSLLAYNISSILSSLKEAEGLAKLLKRKTSLTNVNQDIAIKNVFKDFVDLEYNMFKSLATPYDYTVYNDLHDKAYDLRTKYCYTSINRTSGIAIGFMNKFFQLGTRMGYVADSIYDLGDYTATGLGLIGDDPFIITRVTGAVEEVKTAISGTVSAIAPYISVDFSDPDKNNVYKDTARLLLSNFLKGNLGTSLNAAAFCSVLDPLISLGMRIYGISQDVISFYSGFLQQIARVWKMIKGIFEQLNKMIAESITVAQVSTIALGFISAVPGLRSMLLSILRSLVGSLSPDAIRKIAAYLQTLDLNRRTKILEGKLYVLIDKTYNSVNESSSKPTDKIIEDASKGNMDAAISKVNAIIDNLKNSVIKENLKYVTVIKTNTELRVKIAELSRIRDYFVSKKGASNRSMASDGNIGYGYIFKSYRCSDSINSSVKNSVIAMEEISRELE